MKKFNGTDYDGLLPLAYNALNSELLGGQSLTEVKQWVQDNGLLLYTGRYIGTGTYGANHPTSVTFPFEPILFFFPSELRTLFANTFFAGYKRIDANGRGVYVSITKSVDGKTISWYSDQSASGQYNDGGTTFYYIAIGGHDMGGKIPAGTTFTITSNESWRVPATGRYMLELYGMGGNGFGTPNFGASGGSSCQHYDSITLTKGDIQQIVIGDYSNPATKFGSYSVNNGGDASYNTGGLGSGNYGKNGIVGRDVPATPSNGALSGRYGDGGSAAASSSSPGAVYLKYLGA